MSIIEKYQIANRRRIVNRVVDAISPLHLPPSDKRLIKMVVSGDIPSALVDTQVVEALYTGQMLRVAAASTNYLGAPGWKQTYTRDEDRPTATEMRVIAYRLTEPGLDFSNDIGGTLALDPVRRGDRSLDFTSWELTWESRYQGPVDEFAGQSVVEPISPEPVRTERKPRSSRTRKPKEDDKGPKKGGLAKFVFRPLSFESVNPPDNLTEGQVWHRSHGIGTLAKGDDGAIFRDEEGRYVARFESGATSIIPETLIGKTYIFGTAKEKETE